MNSSESKTILIAGGTGLIGKRLKDLLERKSYKVFLLSRSTTNPEKGIYHWNPEKNEIDNECVKRADVIINLAGEGIADKRWTARRKRKIINSRIFSTKLLAQTLLQTNHHVKLFINASAVGYYGNTGEMIMHESSPESDSFLGNVCKRWENSVKDIENSGIRTVIFRIGIVLDNEGGFMKEIRKPMNLFIAPVFGSGQQYLSWIHIDDLTRLFSKAIRDIALTGVYNAVAPGPLSNYNFMKLLLHISGKPCLLVHIPNLVLRILLGELSIMLTGGTRASSEKIESTGFIFTYPNAGAALKQLLVK